MVFRFFRNCCRLRGRTNAAPGMRSFDELNRSVMLTGTVKLHQPTMPLQNAAMAHTQLYRGFRYLNTGTLKMSELNTPVNKTNTIDLSQSTPNWSVNNPYLEILAPRFFSADRVVDWSDLPKRVSRLFLKAEKNYLDSHVAEARARQIGEIVNDGLFLPNSPVMMNSEGETGVNLFACHVLSPPVSIDDLDIAKQIHDGCGGIGYDFSNIDDPVSATLTIERQTELLNPGRKRKAHSAVTLSYTHPKILEFIEISPNLTITHTNVEFDDAFFHKLVDQDPASLILWGKLCKSIYDTGRPSLSFSAEKARRSPSKLINNVCGESLLRENESSLIGSLNLSRFVVNGTFRFDEFERAARLGLRCLDNLHDIQDHASPVVKARCLESRKVGVGVMGYADALLLLNIRYGSKESFDFIDTLMSLLRSTLVSESEILGKERGFCNQELLASGTRARRNASLMAVPANGTLSLVANVSGGIEPIFAHLTRQKVQDTVVHQLQPTFRRLLEYKKLDARAIFDELMSGKEIGSISAVDDNMKNVLVIANDLSSEEHILTQARFQKYIDGGISKTINFPNSATISDIKDAILLARANSCVGISIYRNGSLDNQPTQMAH
jgi:ribonucleoside-diphosphate reductase alpha chain